MLLNSTTKFKWSPMDIFSCLNNFLLNMYVMYRYMYTGTGSMEQQCARSRTTVAAVIACVCVCVWQDERYGVIIILCQFREFWYAHVLQNC